MKKCNKKRSVKGEVEGWLSAVHAPNTLMPLKSDAYGDSKFMFSLKNYFVFKTKKLDMIITIRLTCCSSPSHLCEMGSVSVCESLSPRSEVSKS